MIGEDVGKEGTNAEEEEEDDEEDEEEEEDEEDGEEEEEAEEGLVKSRRNNKHISPFEGLQGYASIFA